MQDKDKILKELEKCSSLGGSCKWGECKSCGASALFVKMVTGVVPEIGISPEGAIIILKS